MPSSHAPPDKATSLLLLVALSIVAMRHPEWLAVSVADAARQLVVHPSYVSRLAGRFLEPARALVASLIRRGRKPARRAESNAQAELRKTRALLAVATSALGTSKPRGGALRAIVLAAFVRLQAEYGISITEFCAALALSPRTFRAWRARPADPADRQPPSTPPFSEPRPPKPKKRPPRRPRFQFDVFLPDTQFGGDTTDLRAFGVDLKLIGVQDIGGRDGALFTSVVIDTAESADHVIKAFEPVLAQCPGAQALTDQGTPYMAEPTCDLFGNLEVEHAPQAEADPRGKATVERGFGSLKHILQPLLDVTDALADKLPLLRSAEIAVPFARLATGIVLRAYQAGARAARRALDTRGASTDGELARAAARARDAARATDRSVRLWLEHVHNALRFAGSEEQFVRNFRRYPLDVLKDAERSLRQRLLNRDDIRDLARYYGALVRTAFDAFRTARRISQESHALLDQRRRDEQHAAAERRAFLQQPLRWLQHALDLIAMQWLPHRRELLFDGVGAGSGNLSAALARIATIHGASGALDMTRTALDDFCRAHRHNLGNDGIIAVVRVVETHLVQFRKQDSTVANSALGATPLKTRGDHPLPLTISTA
jgi:hypothetical protein